MALQSIAAGLWLSAAYLIALMTLADGMNADFAAFAWPILLGAGLAALIAARLLPGDGRPSPGKRWPRLADLAYVIVPLTPVIGYLLGNPNDIELQSVLLTTAYYLVVLSATILLIPLALTKIADRRIVMACVSALAFVLLSAASLGSNTGRTAAPTQLALFVVVVTVLMLFSLAPRSVLVVATVLFLVLQSGSALINARASHSATAAASDSDLEGRAAMLPWESRPNVYLIVYDSYANRETLRAYGIDNEAQLTWLEQQGFTIYDGTYSTHTHSLASMSRMLEASTDVGANERSYTAGDAAVVREFAAQGYQTRAVMYHEYMFGKSTPTWDDYFPVVSGSESGIPDLAGDILEGQIDLAAGFTEVDRGEYLMHKRAGLRESDEPVFMYAHGGYPSHSMPNCRADEHGYYERRLAEANVEMRDDLDAIPDLEHSIVIIAGDHGPHLLRDCFVSGYPLADLSTDEITRFDLQDRHGTFLAIHWPEGTAPAYGIQLLQDVFPAVVAYLSGDQTQWTQRRTVPVVRQWADGPVLVDGGVIEAGVDADAPLFLGPR